MASTASPPRPTSAGAARTPRDRPDGWTVAGLVVVFVAAGLRLFALDGQSLWYDEAVTILLARQPIPELVRRTAEDTLPPLSYLVLHPWLGLGGGDFWMRFPSAWFGTLTVAIVYRWARDLAGGRAVVGAAGVVAVSPWFVFYSQEVRLYAGLGLLLAAYLWIAGRPESTRRIAALTGLGTLALYTHPLAAALVLPLPGLVRAAVDRRIRAGDWLPVGIALVLFLPWAGVLLGQSRRVLTTFWAEPTGPLRAIVSLDIFAFGPPIAAWHLGAGLALLIGTVALGWRLGAGDRRPVARAALVAALPPVGLMLISSIRPVYLDRVLIGAGIGLAAWAGVSWARLPARLGAGLAAAWVLVAGVGLVRWYADPAAGKPDYRSAAVYVRRAADPADPVLHTSDGSHHPFLVYAPDLANRLLAGDPDYAAGSPRGRWTTEVMGIAPVPAESVGEETGRVWLVIALDHAVDWQRAEAERIDRLWQPAGERHFGAIVVREYRTRRE